MSAYAVMPSSPRFALRLPRMTRARMFGALACLLGGAIAVNATLFQPERHPAPMFRTLARPAATPVDAPVPPLRGDIREKSAPLAALPAASDKAVRAAEPLADAEANEFLLRDIQSELARRGFYKGEPDGMPGPATAKAIRDYQESRKLPVDGIASDALLAGIRAQRQTMKDDLLDILKQANAPEKPAVRPAAKAPEKHGSAPKVSAARNGAPLNLMAQGNKAAPAKSDSAKSASAKTVPAKTVPAKTASAKSASAKSVSAKSVSAKTAPRTAATKAPAPRVAPVAPARAAPAEQRLLPPMPVPVASAQDARARR